MVLRLLVLDLYLKFIACVSRLSCSIIFSFEKSLKTASQSSYFLDELSLSSE